VNLKTSARQRSRKRLEERERVILAAAARAFASAGFHATTTRQIAANAGVSEGTVFHYFGSKNDLMVAVLDGFYNEVLNPKAAEILDTVMGTRARLLALATHHVRALAADNALMMRLLQVYAGVDLEFREQGGDSPLRELNRNYVGYLDRILREGMERGDLRGDLELRPLRDLFFGTMEYGVRTHLYRHGEHGLDDYVERLLDPVWRGLRAEEPDGGDKGDLLQRLKHLSDRLEHSADRLEQSAGRLETKRQP
jgi:AcrR family transcriptional regulator